METAFAIYAIISFIILVWLISTLGNILTELRVHSRQQAMLLAFKKAEGNVTFDDSLLPDYERFYAMKKGKLLK